MKIMVLSDYGNSVKSFIIMGFNRVQFGKGCFPFTKHIWLPLPNYKMQYDYLHFSKFYNYRLFKRFKKNAKGINRHKNYLKLRVFSMEQKIPTNKPALFQL